MAADRRPAIGAGPRLIAARALLDVLDHGTSLTDALAGLDQLPSGRDRALARRLCNRVLRNLPMLEWRLGRLLDKPLKRNARLVHCLLLVGLDQLAEQREPAAAVVHACVAAAGQAGQRHLAGLVNAVLRNHQRRAASLAAEQPESDAIRFGYPDWLLGALRTGWPAHWQSIADAGNQSPPMWLRVNRRRTTPGELAGRLAAVGIECNQLDAVPDALKLARHARVSTLPGYAEGLFSVQDAGAQAAVDLLRLEPGMRVLDACAAPGGKAAHILERADVGLTAVELDPRRAQRIEQNFGRLGLTGRVVIGDATRPGDWLHPPDPGDAFDRILLDAPCSATGVVRRHPEIRWLRRASDLDTLIGTQRALLEALWPYLAPGGLLVYATCSILHAENREPIRAFLQNHDDARDVEFELADTQACQPGRQILPGSLDRDGFYYACLGRV